MMSPDAFKQRGYDIVADVATAARSHGLKRDQFPQLTSDSGTERTEAVMLGHGVGRVNLPGAIKRFMKHAFPSFAFDRSVGDLHRFTQKTSNLLALYVEFERIHHYGLGKTFTVHIGAIYQDATITGRNRFSISLMSFFDRSSMDWIYGTASDLDACLAEAGQLLTIVLPAFQAEWEKKIPEAISTGTRHTFHAAAEIAYRRFESFYPQFSTIGHAHWVESNRGILPSGTWVITFNDDSADRSLRTDVLPNGRVLFGLGNQMFIRRGDLMHRASPRRYVNEDLALRHDPTPSPVIRHRPWSAFIDSTHAMEIADRNGGADFSSDPENLSTQLQLHAQRADPQANDEEWRVFYHENSAARRHLSITLSARTGEILG